MSASIRHHYNPDWLSDDALVANFVARVVDFSFLRDDLSRAPLTGSVQHYLLVGVRGAGKTTLLKRLAVAIRRDADLKDHLIALSFPEELYQVKNLSDFWWAACAALVDELDRMGLNDEADDLSEQIEQGKRTRNAQDPISDTGFQLLQQSCGKMERRPVLLVDNLDMVFDRIDKSGRKLKDPHSTSYWALRETLSTSTAPIIIGGSVRLSAPFKDYDKAFYDFFIAKRLGKLTLPEVRLVLEHLAEAQGIPELKPRLNERPGRIQALFELTGGNPRALSLIFDLLRNGPNGRAVEDFERLMDITTPYYKARIEDLSEQAQVVMHALAVHSSTTGLQFGSTAAEIGGQSGLPTSTVSAQLSLLENEGLVEKSTDHGRAQYRIAEQLFRLWLQMRSSRRIRYNVIGLTKFFEAMYDPDELQACIKVPVSATPLADAKYAFAVAATNEISLHQRQDLEAYGLEKLHLHLASNGEQIDDYLIETDPARVVQSITPEQATKLESTQDLIANANMAFAKGDFTQAEIALRQALENTPPSPVVLKLLAVVLNQTEQYDEAEKIVRTIISSDSRDVHGWAVLGSILARNSERHEEAEAAFLKALALTPNDAFLHMVYAGFLADDLAKFTEAEASFKRSLDLDPNQSTVWVRLAQLLIRIGNRDENAEDILLRAIEIDSMNTDAWLILGKLYAQQEKFSDAEIAINKALELDPKDVNLLTEAASITQQNGNPDRAEAVYRQAVSVAPEDLHVLLEFGSFLLRIGKTNEATSLIRKVVEAEPDNDNAMAALAASLSLEEDVEKEEQALSLIRRSIEIDATWASRWTLLGLLLSRKKINDPEAVIAVRKASELFPENEYVWLISGFVLGKMPEHYDEAIASLNKAHEIAPDSFHPLIALGEVFERLGKDDDAMAAYTQAMKLENTSSESQIKIRNLNIKMTLIRVQRALTGNNSQAMHEELLQLLSSTEEIPTIVVSEQFIEGFLKPLLAEPAQAAIVLTELRGFGFERHARPLLLAFEAAIENREDMLTELEPEIQSATKTLFQRLKSQ